MRVMKNNARNTKITKIIPEGYIYFSKYRKVINKRSAIVVC